MQKRDLYYERIPTKLLREDVKYLGNVLGKVIKDQEGKNFFELIEKVRKLSKANKKKSSLWWVTTLGYPDIAKPIPIPKIEFSELGISNTLLEPNFFSKFPISATFGMNFTSFSINFSIIF